MTDTTRADAIRTIGDLYGCQGSDYITDDGDRLLLHLFADHGGLSLLTDEGVAKLAQSHRYEDGRQARIYARRA